MSHDLNEKCRYTISTDSAFIRIQRIVLLHDFNGKCRYMILTDSGDIRIQ